jgi:hypothetical protein
MVTVLIAGARIRTTVRSREGPWHDRGVAIVVNRERPDSPDASALVEELEAHLAWMRRRAPERTSGPPPGSLG